VSRLLAGRTLQLLEARERGRGLASRLQRARARHLPLRIRSRPCQRVKATRRLDDSHAAECCPQPARDGAGVVAVDLPDERRGGIVVVDDERVRAAAPVKLSVGLVWAPKLSALSSTVVPAPAPLMAMPLRVDRSPNASRALPVQLVDDLDLLDGRGPRARLGRLLHHLHDD